MCSLHPAPTGRPRIIECPLLLCEPVVDARRSRVAGGGRVHAGVR